MHTLSKGQVWVFGQSQTLECPVFMTVFLMQFFNQFSPTFGTDGDKRHNFKQNEENMTMSAYGV